MTESTTTLDANPETISFWKKYFPSLTNPKVYKSGFALLFLLGLLGWAVNMYALFTYNPVY